MIEFQIKITLEMLSLKIKSQFRYFNKHETFSDLGYSVAGSNPLSLEPEPSYLISFYAKRFSQIVSAYLCFHMGDPLCISLCVILGYPPIQTQTDRLLSC